MRSEDKNKDKDNDKDKVGFEEVLGTELVRLSELRGGIKGDGASSYARARHSSLAGLALSGGGIRSATFNLGVIQTLSEHGLLSKFDYLSTVSGGGYIGAWLSALLHRKAGGNGKPVDQQEVTNFQSSLKTHPANHEVGEFSGFAPPEHTAARFLRGYSNYLSPRLGLSGDALAVVSIFLRNFMLIQLILISLVASVLLLAHVVGVISDKYIQPAWAALGGVLALIVAVWCAGRLLKERGARPEKPAIAARKVILLVVFPCALAAWLLSIAAISGKYDATLWMWAGSIAYAIAWISSYVIKKSPISSHRNPDRPKNSRRKNAAEDSERATASWATHFFATAFSAALLGLLLFATIKAFPDSGASIDPWIAVAFGPPLFLLGLSFVVTIHMGAARRAFTVYDREWLARLGGFVLAISAAWALLFAVLLYATPFVNWLAGGRLSTFVVWAAGSGFGAWLGQSSSTSGTTTGLNWTQWSKEMLARLAPWLFLAGLVVIIAYGTHILLAGQGDTSTSNAVFADLASTALRELDTLPVERTVAALVIVALLFGLMTWRFDINLFSLHHLYRNRLMRAYLSASRTRERKPNPFTGFDPDDDLELAQLQNQRPIPIINTAINMTGGDDLAWQTRRAASFAFTPAWSGFETYSSDGTRIGHYCPTDRYAGGLTLGDLVAISGAAASPNMGYHTSTAVSMLMTAFNLRLGRWCGNPERDTWELKSPSFAAKPIFAELTGSATAKADWINLTDGGHFENLGVYELVRRRCRLIVVTDVGCDPNYEFEDLANALKKCWTDFGVTIRFDNFDPMHRQVNGRYCGAHTAIGRIEYHDNEPDGAIVYLKSSLTGKEQPIIRHYADIHADFPHESTGDQFFDENQFEAYRYLGHWIATDMVRRLREILRGEPKDFAVNDIVSQSLGSH